MTRRVIQILVYIDCTPSSIIRPCIQNSFAFVFEACVNYFLLKLILLRTCTRRLIWTITSDTQYDKIRYILHISTKFSFGIVQEPCIQRQQGTVFLFRVCNKAMKNKHVCTGQRYCILATLTQPNVHYDSEHEENERH